MRAGNIFLSTCSLLGAVSVAGQARAADPNLRIAVHDGACVVTEGVPLQGDALALEAAQPLTKLEVRWESGATVEVDGEGTGWIIRRPQGKQAQKGILEFAFMDAGTEKTVECAERTLFEAVRTGKQPDAGAKTSPNPLAVHDARASRWWVKYGPDALLTLRKQLVQLRNAGSVPKEVAAKPDGEIELDDVHLLVHLPSGAVAPPFRARVSEGESAQVVLIMPSGANITADVEVTGCEDVHPFRVRSKGTATDPEKHDARELDPNDFELRTIGEQLRCGPDEFSYTIWPTIHAPELPGGDKQAEDESETEPSGASTTITVGSRNHLAGVAVVGYSSAEQVEFEKRTDRSEDDATVTIAEKEERRGAGVYVGALWMLGGVDYGNMRWYNYFANVFVSANPESPLEDIVAGLSFTLSGGVSLSAGINVLKGVRLDDYSVGDQFTGDGAIPTKESWKEASVGFFGGLAIDTDIYEALIASK